MPLTSKQKRYLRGLGHHLSPVVQIGQNGVTEGVIHKIKGELLCHELIKIRLGGGAEEGQDEVVQALAALEAEHVQSIGHTLLLYKRRAKDPEIELP